MVHGGSHFEKPAPALCRSHSKMHMIIVALDYRNTGGPLSCTIDGRNMEELARRCGIHDVQTLFDDTADCTKEAVLQTIRSVGRHCHPGDYFIFYFSGWCANVQEISREPGIEKDKAFMLVGRDGRVSKETMLTGKEFSNQVLQAVDRDTNVLLLVDSCYHEEVIDFGHNEWEKQRAIAMFGLLSDATPRDASRSGIFTHSMLLAIEKIASFRKRDYSVGRLYNAALQEDKCVFNDAQDIVVRHSLRVAPDQMAWPMIPLEPYKAPFSKLLDDAERHQAHPQSVTRPEVLQMMGVKPAHLQFLHPEFEISTEPHSRYFDDLEGPEKECRCQ